MIYLQTEWFHLRDRCFLFFFSIVIFFHYCLLSGYQNIIICFARKSLQKSIYGCSFCWSHCNIITVPVVHFSRTCNAIIKFLIILHKTVNILLSFCYTSASSYLFFWGKKKRKKKKRESNSKFEVLRPEWCPPWFESVSIVACIFIGCYVSSGDCGRDFECFVIFLKSATDRLLEKIISRKS